MTEAEWLARPDPLENLEASHAWPSPRKQRLFAVACCRRIERLLPDDPGWRQALAVAERYAERKATKADLSAALPVARTPFDSPGRTYGHQVAQFAEFAVGWACRTNTRRYAAHVASSAAYAAAYAALPVAESGPYVAIVESIHRERWSDAERAEKRAQLELLLDVWGNPFRPAPARPARLGRDVARLAQAAYEQPLESGELDPARLAVLSDALEDAGCTDVEILAHLRSPSPHVRGCWALDLVLGKE
jgi:hypothetical protein